jgi:hypothetical protein
MVKKAALSVRIPKTTKEGIDKVAARHDRSTASLVGIILRDFLARADDGPHKYPPGPPGKDDYAAA